MEKTVKGILYEWESYHPMDDMGERMLIRGRTLLDLPKAEAVRHNWIVTSEVIRFFRVAGVLHVETKNSIYILVDENPFKRGG